MLDVARVTTTFTSAAYRAQHHSFLAVTALIMRVFHAAMNPHMKRPPTAQMDALMRRVQQLLADDLHAMEAGLLPRDLVLEMPVASWMREAPRLLADLPRILVRKHRGDIDDLPLDVDRARYPPYYLRSFHWQSDGWLSQRSARLYDPGVEILFGGTADVMRRSAIVPLARAVVGIDRPRILDVACGTGRLLGQIGRVLPRAHLFGLDLSRPYVEHARAALDERFGHAGPEVDLVVDNAESMPWRDAHFDGVTCVFLFHELPRDARRRVVAEMFRVLRPGGVAVVIDSAQRHDGGDILDVIEAFPSVYHEPYYKSFLVDPVDGLLEDAGFVVEDRAPAFVASRTVARRPLMS